MYIGIDLGTSNSAVSCYHRGQVNIVTMEGGENILPSVIYLDAQGRKLYGPRAFEQMVLAPDNVASGFKRLMGTSTELMLGHGHAMTPEQASSDIVRQLLSQVFKAFPDEEVEGCIVTIPAAFNQMQSEATLRATQDAGIQEVGLLQEPIAASMAAIADGELDTGLFLVYDLGGGTFDVALVQSVGGAVNVLDNMGINMLGGVTSTGRSCIAWSFLGLRRTSRCPMIFSRWQTTSVCCVSLAWPPSGRKLPCREAIAKPFSSPATRLAAVT